MFCPECGAEIADDSKFCTNCGAKIETKTVVNDVEVVENDGGNQNEFNNVGNSKNDVVPFVNDVETIENDDFDDGQTEIIFDKKLPTDRLKKGNKSHAAIVVVGMILVIGIAAAAVLMNSNNNKKQIAEMKKTGIETVDNGKVMYNKGNKEYAYDELIDDGGSTYYFNSNGEMVKNEWVENKGNWYYCESDGKIAKSKWLESTYYVNEYGVMLKNTTTPDGYFVGADGKYVDQAALLAAQKAAQISTGGGGGSGGGNSGGGYTGTTTPAVQPKTGSKQVTSIDYSKEVYIVAYDRYQSYVYYDDDTSVDIIIDYPIFGGQNGAEVDLMNNAMQYCLTNELESYIDSDINNKTEDTKPPRRVNINEATVASIEQNKIYVILKGNLERKNAASVKLNYRFIYERENGSAYIRD
ncbi:MAG: zinc-ribbon domain-containing protein [Lachnospiraceae bacterium]|nr:zinc-ribbon domain-containing protein [Lachnospiraceae bacterium]